MKPIGHHRYQLIGCTVGMTAFLGGLAAVNQNRRSLAIAVRLLLARLVIAVRRLTGLLLL